MRLISFNGVAFSAAVSAKWDSLNSPSASRSSVEQSRIGADPIVSGIEVGSQTITASFVSTGANIEQAFFTVLAIINPDKPVPGVLVGQLVDGVTNVETIAIPGSWRYQGVNQLLIDFIVATPGWRASSTTTLLAATTYTADGNFPNLNTGLRDSLPTITGYWPSPGTFRASKTTTFGYESKISYTLTNNGAEPIINEPWQIGPVFTNGSGIPMSASAIKANYDDLRVFCEGVEWPRNLIGGSTSNTSGYMFIWVVIPFLAPGGTMTLDVVFNNASAGTPTTLSYSSTPALPAIDITGDWFAVSASTGTTVSKAAATWVASQWDGGTVMTGNGGTGSLQMRRVNANTTTQLTVTRAWSTNPATTNCVVIKSGMMGDGGTASGVASLVLTDSSQVWVTNEWIGATIQITGGTGSGTTGTVVSNTATTLTVASWSSTAPTAASTYNVFRKNGVWLYDVRRVATQTSQGLWSTNSVTRQPSQVNFDSPASWYRFVLNRSRDSYSQPRSDNTTSTIWHAVMRLRRSRRGKAGDQTEVGVADSIGVSCPFGMIGTQFAYTIRNAKKQGVAAGMCEFKGVCQESGGEVWASFHSNTTVNNTTAAVAAAWYDLTGYGYPIRLGMALVPNASDEVPDTDNNTAEVRSDGNYLKIAINPNNVLAESPAIYPSVGTVVSCYDVALRIRTGGASSVRPYARLEIGATGHRLFLAINTERLVINCETHDIYLTDAAGTLVKRIPWAVQPQEIIDDINGAAATVVASRWLPIPPSAIDAAAIYFSDPSGAGWGNFRIGVTGKLGYIT